MCTPAWWSISLGYRTTSGSRKRRKITIAKTTMIINILVKNVKKQNTKRIIEWLGFALTTSTATNKSIFSNIRGKQKLNLISWV